jgi:hypothetical protein
MLFGFPAIFFLFVPAANIANLTSSASAEDKLAHTAWMSCSGKFSSDPDMARAAKGSARPGCARDPMARNEAFNSCRDQFGAMVLIVVKTRTGWQCRYGSPTGPPRKK